MLNKIIKNKQKEVEISKEKCLIICLYGVRYKGGVSFTWGQDYGTREY